MDIFRLESRDIARNQINSVPINKRFRNSVTKLCQYIEENAACDRTLVAISITVKVNKSNNLNTNTKLLGMKTELRQNHASNVQNKHETLKTDDGDNSAVVYWDTMSITLNTSV